MKLFFTKQIAELDKYTIENEPISDIDLMERASLQISKWLVQRFSTDERIVVFAGPGNNGGDALAIARQMADLNYKCSLYILHFEKTLLGSPKINLQRLLDQGKVEINEIVGVNDFPKINSTDIVLDGIFGSGLTRPLTGLPAEIVGKINQLSNTVVSIDLPSGLMGEDNTENYSENIIQADFTLTFQFPKLSFLFPENEQYVGLWEVLRIGLHPEGISKAKSIYTFIEKEEIQKLLPLRSRFAHKGTFGHALLMAGSYGKMGAAVLAAKACLRAGVGLLTAHIPRVGYLVIQTAVPEAMTSVDQHDSICTEFPDLSPFSAIGIGPGLGQKQNSCRALCSLLEKAKVPLVIDADALNILSGNRDWLYKIPENSILTPHPGEFKRLVGETENSYDRIKKQIQFSRKYKIVLLVKGAFTSVSTPSGEVYFNSTGNPGMATAGSGDVLIGIILGLLGGGMTSESAAIAGVYIHGLAGDLAAYKKSQFSLIAGDLIDFMGEAFLSLKNDSTK